MKPKAQNFERELPEGYKQALHLNAKNAKFGIIFNLISLLIMVLIMVLALLTLHLNGRLSWDILTVESTELLLLVDFIFILSLFGYIVLHEVVHGIAYKSMTGERLTFGMSWSCAFCGVPHIYTYRRCAIIAIISPLVTFTLILLPLTAVLYFVSPLYFLMSALLFGIHLGGCSGDMYALYLLMAKFRNKRTLIRDTGPEQFFYVPDEGATPPVND